MISLSPASNARARARLHRKYYVSRTRTYIYTIEYTHDRTTPTPAHAFTGGRPSRLCRRTRRMSVHTRQDMRTWARFVRFPVSGRWRVERLRETHTERVWWSVVGGLFVCVWGCSCCRLCGGSVDTKCDRSSNECHGELEFHGFVLLRLSHTHKRLCRGD